MTSTTETTETRIYVACLHCYNSGRLHGQWIEANQDAEDIQEETNEMLKNCPDGHPSEEWAIHDYEGFGSIRFCEYDSFKNIAQCAKMVQEYGEALISIAITWSDLDHEQALDALENQYVGAYESLEDWAEEMLEEDPEFQALPERFKQYFDYASYIRDMELGGDIYHTRANGQVHIFWNN